MNPTKCTFFQKEIRFVGNYIKIKAFENFPNPKSRESCVTTSLVGLPGHNRGRIKDFAPSKGGQTVVPTDEEGGVQVRIDWEAANSLMKTPILAMRRKNGKFVLDNDASAFGTGCVFFRFYGKIRRNYCASLDTQRASSENQNKLFEKLQR